MPLPEGAESEKIKRDGSTGSGAGLLKRRAGTFPIWFFQGLSFLHLEITLLLQNCVMLLKEKYFFLPL